MTLSVQVSVGDVIPPLTWSPDRIAGHVIATGDSAGDALTRCERTVAAVAIESAPVASESSVQDKPEPAMTEA